MAFDDVGVAFAGGDVVWLGRGVDEVHVDKETGDIEHLGVELGQGFGQLVLLAVVRGLACSKVSRGIFRVWSCEVGLLVVAVGLIWN